jgi:dihydrolipoamide dehydrogenase
MQYDTVVLGAGPGGGAAAQQVAMHGGTACLIEHNRIGGTCVNVGCMPTKAMLAASGLYHRAGQAERFGLQIDRRGVDGPAFMARVHQVVTELTDSLRDKISGMDHVDYRIGHARITAPGEVAIQTENGPQSVRGRTLVIATGSRPRLPGALPADDERVWTSNDAVAAEDLPDSVLVLGGGALGCEFATVYSELGRQVTLVEMNDRLLPRLDAKASDVAADALRDAGVSVRTGARVREVISQGQRLCTRFEDGPDVSAQVILTAAGREPVLDDCGLDVIAPEMDEEIIRVDDRGRTSVENTYAIGDCANRRRHAHVAMHMGMVAGDDIMGKPPHSDLSLIPAVVYTHPEIACIGLCGEDQCRDCDNATTIELDASGTAYIYGHDHVLLKIVADAETGRIRGATWAGPHASDLIHEIVLAMRADVTLPKIYATVHGHPSMVEMFHTAAEEFMQQRSRD